MEYRTIIVEDDKPIRELLALTAEMRGHEVLTFSSPIFCSLANEETCPRDLACSDMIISDQCMPYMTGLDFFSILQEKNCLIPNKALVTAVDGDEIKYKADELGCTLITKPFNIAEILSWLEESELSIPEERTLVPRESLIADKSAPPEP